MSEARELRIEVGDAGTVSALLTAPASARTCYVLAHGAGVGMRHAFMAAVANGLHESGVACLRYQFPYMEAGGGRPDSPRVAQATVRAAVAEAAKLLPKAALFAGGKSFGGRMTSQAQAAEPLPGVRGLAFLGFPLHTPGDPSDDRAEHLFEVKVPMLFLQGANDKFAELAFLAPLIQRLKPHATLHLFPHADHSFHVPKKSGRTDADVMAELLDTLVKWMGSLVP